MNANLTDLISVFGKWELPTLKQIDRFVYPSPNEQLCHAKEVCSPGTFLPVWQPSLLQRPDPVMLAVRSVIYSIALAYLLFGSSVIASRITESTWRMASQRRRDSTLFWHPVVARLTFGVAGTSSTEILLPWIEVWRRGFRADELGPSLIVGSAAYHMFFITAVCLFSTSHDARPRPLLHWQGFAVPAIFGLLAHVWIYLIIGIWSPGVVEVWEALLTVVWYPVLVISAWLIARKFVHDDDANSVTSTLPSSTELPTLARIESTSSCSVIVIEEPKIEGHCSVWAAQLRATFKVPEAEHGLLSRSFNYVIFFVALPWKTVVALTPPVNFAHGWLTFFSNIGLVAIVAALLGDVASHFGCTVGMKDVLTALTLMPIGTGLPDTVSSRHAALAEMSADAALGQISGSNGASVFLGIGIAWTMGAAYQQSYGKSYRMPPADFGFSIILYLSFSVLTLAILIIRRHLPYVGGELGGARPLQIATGVFFIFLWIMFVTLSALESYCFISGISPNVNS